MTLCWLKFVIVMLKATSLCQYLFHKEMYIFVYSFVVQINSIESQGKSSAVQSLEIFLAPPCFLLLIIPNVCQAKGCHCIHGNLSLGEENIWKSDL